MAIGGFPVDSVTEDYLLSLRLKERGFLTAYLNEPLTYRLAPEGLKEYNAVVLAVDEKPSIQALERARGTKGRCGRARSA